MDLTVTNLEEIPDDLAPGVYCCRLESMTWQEMKVRFVPGSRHKPGDCLIQLTKAAPSCPVCRDTGIVQCAETNPEDGVYEQACPEKVHDGEDVTFPADPAPSTPLSDWNW